MKMNNQIKRRLFFISFGISICINLLFFRYDVYEVIKPKLVKERTYIEENPNFDVDLLERNIIDAGFAMASANSVEMVWNDDGGATRKLLNTFSDRNTSREKEYNYPKAYLLFGLARYSQNVKPERMGEVKNIFDKYLDQNGNPNFDLDKIDQVVFGLTALILYDHYGEKKYLTFSSLLVEFIKKHRHANGVIAYRIGQINILNDVLGMVVPFLTMYSKTTADPECFDLAYQQVSEYIKYGVDESTYMPNHAYNLESKIQVGSSNWGRGIGWYYLALAYINRFDDRFFKRDIQGLSSTMWSLQNSDDLWSQYPGSSDKFDASTTTLFIYCEGLLSSESLKNQFIRKLVTYIDAEGYVLETSGDTYAINNYSRTFGKSELSQAFLILFLAN